MIKRSVSKNIIIGFMLALVSGLFIISFEKEVFAGDDGYSGTNFYAGLSCRQLWYERNRIFAEYGYCFSSDRGRRTFPNSCFPPYGELPRNLKRTVNKIKSWERRRSC